MARVKAGSSPWKCWFCDSEVAGEPFCPQCSKLQPLSPELDYFQLFGIRRQLNLDPEGLERTFYELSRRFHPDRYSTASEEERGISLVNSSILNRGYRTLRDPLERMRYLLALEIGPSEGEGGKAPPGLLEEVMEVQEALMELKEIGASGDGDERDRLLSTLKGARERLEGLKGDMERRLEELARTWDRMLDGEGGDKGGVLTEMKELLSNLNYLRTVLRNIGEET